MPASPSDGHTAPNRSAEAKPRSLGAAGRLLVCPHTRVRGSSDQRAPRPETTPRLAHRVLASPGLVLIAIQQLRAASLCSIPLEHVRGHQNSLTLTTTLPSCQAPQLDRSRFPAKKVCRHVHRPNMVRPNCTISMNYRKSVYDPVFRCRIDGGARAGTTYVRVVICAWLKEARREPARVPTTSRTRPFFAT